MSSPLVSVLTTSYNRAEYIRSTIESVLHQTFQDFEYIIVDDCSTDDSLRIARRYESDPRVKVYANERNLGDYANRNQAIHLARGRYLKFVDCDDIAYPHCLQTMLDHLERFPQAGVAFSWRERPPWHYPVVLSPEQAYRLHFAEGGVLHQGSLSALLRRDALLAVGGFPEIYTGDVACWLKLARSAPVVLTQGGLFWWREHAGQLSQSLRTITRQWAAHQAEGTRLHWEALSHPACPLPATERDKYRRSLVRQYLAMLLRSVLRGRFAVAAELWHGRPCGWYAAVSAMMPSRSPQTFPSPREPQVAQARLGRVDANTLLPSAPSILSSPTPRVSVLMPLYNEEAGVDDAIRSVIAQDGSDWELVLVDDASTDRTAAIAQSFADGRRIHFHQNHTHLGKWANHNRCGEHARGSYLKFLHGADILYPGALETFLWYAAKSPEAGLVLSSSDERQCLPRLLSPVQAYLAEYFGVLSFGESPSGLLYQKGAWQASGGLDAGCAGAPLKLHLLITRSAPAFLIPAGMVAYARGSQQLRRIHPRGSFWGSEEFPWLHSFLQHRLCPLDPSQKQQAAANLNRAEKLLAWKHRIGSSNPISRAIQRSLPQPFTTAAEFCGAFNQDVTFDHALYPPSRS